MHLEGAECLASYGTDFYAGMPAITKNTFGNGTTYYIGTRLDAAGLMKVLDAAMTNAGVAAVIAEPTELEVICRTSENARFYFIMNFKDGEYPIPACFESKTDLLTGEQIKPGELLPKYAVRLVQIALN